jgi:hypothetical protein
MNSRERKGLFAIRILPALLATVAATWSADLPGPKDRPYVRMFTCLSNTREAAAVNSLQGPNLDVRLAELMKWYVHFHGEMSRAFPFGDIARGTGEGTLAEKLSRRGAWVTSYFNGSNVTQGNKGWGMLHLHDAADIESKAPLAMATFWPGHKNPSTGSDADTAARLTGTVDATQELLLVTSAAKWKPETAPETWPYVPSRGKGAAPGAVLSDNTHDFVSWVRIDDEIMRVRSVGMKQDSLSLIVERAYFGTKSTAHAAHARVLSPVYVGATGSSAADRVLAGSPLVNDPDRALLYGIKIWRPEAVTWIANQIKETFGNRKPAPYLQGHNGVWLDITGCVAYDNGDAYGRPVSPWDDPHETVMTNMQFGDYNIAKLKALRRHFDGKTGYADLIWVTNNLAARTDEDCCNHVIADGGYDGAVLEQWLLNLSLWDVQMDQNFLIQANNWPALYWVKWSWGPLVGKAEMLPRYKRFTYGALLLAYRPTATRFQYGGDFGLTKPDEFYFYDWGKPKDAPARITDLPRQSCRTPDGQAVSPYRRDFENGFVLVNNSKQTAVCELSSTFYDIVGQQRVARVTVPSADSAFLFGLE